MDSIKTIAPIFFAKTRSFLFGILPILLTMIDTAFSDLSAGGTGGPLIEAISGLLGAAPAEVQLFLLKLIPVWTLIFAQQRGLFSGATPRPYTISPAKEKLIVQVIEDGKSAFEAGKAFGERLKAKKV